MTEKHIANNFSWIRGKIRRLPVIHQTTLRAMLEHLGKIAANSKQNKMDAKNLAVVFGPVLLGEEPATGSMDILMISKVRSPLTVWIPDAQQFFRIF